MRTDEELHDLAYRAVSRWRVSSFSWEWDEAHAVAIVTAYEHRDEPHAGTIVLKCRSAAIDEFRRLCGREKGHSPGQAAKHEAWATMRHLDYPIYRDGNQTIGDVIPDTGHTPEEWVCGETGFDDVLDRIANWPDLWKLIATRLDERIPKQAIAEELGVSPGRVSQILRDMRADLDPENWNTFYEIKHGAARRGNGLGTMRGHTKGR